MVNRFVRGAGDGGAWTGTVTTLATGVTNAVAGEDIYVAADHTEGAVAAAVTYTSAGTGVNPCRIFVATHTAALVGGAPPASAIIHTPTVTVSTTGVSSHISLAGVVSHCEGIIFSAGAAGNAANIQCNAQWYLKNCSLVLNNTSVSSIIRPTNLTLCKNVWDNCTVTFGIANQMMTLTGGEWTWKNTPNAILGTPPTTLFSGSCNGTAILRGVDLSAMTPSKTLIANSQSSVFNVTMINCKEPATWTRYGATQTGDFCTVVMERCENGATNIGKTKEDFFGTQTTEPTIIRTGGATDGTTPTALRIDTSVKAKTRPQRPFKTTPMVIWNDVVSTNRVVTVYGAIFGAAAPLPTNADIWMEVEYMGSSTSPISTLATTTIATPLTTPVAVAADGSTWGGSTTAFKLVATLSSPQPGMKGPMIIRVCVGQQSIFFIDWQPVLS